MENTPQGSGPQYFDSCNGGSQGGFGSEYVNEEEFKFGEINEPVKYSNAVTMAFIIAANAFFLYMCHYIYLWGFSWSKEDNWRTIIFFFSLIIYLVVNFACNNLTSFIDNTQDFSHYDQIFSNMAKDNCFFKFNVRCYHTEKSGKNTKTVTTHRATIDYYCKEVMDNSGEIKEIKREGDNLVFVHYLKRYSFGNQQTKEQFRNNYNQFAGKHIVDKNQQFSFSLQIPAYQQYVCYSNKNVKWVKDMFYVSIFMGLGSAYLLWAETMIDRYEVKIHKILTN